MLIFPLKKHWYEKIKSGEKTVEYREMKIYWIKRICNATQEWNYQNNYTSVIFESETNEEVKGITKMTFIKKMPCILQNGYNPKTRLKADISKIEVVNGKYTDLAIDKSVYAIHLSNVRESSISEVEK